MGRFVQRYGGLHYIGAEVDALRAKWTQLAAPQLTTAATAKAQQCAAHITVVAPDEWKGVKGLWQDEAEEHHDIIDVGVGTIRGEVHYVVIPFFPKATAVRRAVGLHTDPDFHVTLAYKDTNIHTHAKTVETLCLTAAPSIHHDLGYLYHTCRAWHRSGRGLRDVHAWLRAHVPVQEGLHRHEYFDKVVAVLNHPVVQQVSPNWEKRPCWYYRDGPDTLAVHRAPRNFSWVTPAIAGSATLGSEDAFHFLCAAGVTAIVSLLDGKEAAGLPLQQWMGAAHKHVPHEHVCVADLTPPTTAQVRRLIAFMEGVVADGRVVVHCMGGRGRTATALVCYLVWKRGISANEARRMLDATGRVTHTTKAQDAFIGQWEKECARNGLRVQLPRVVMMVGLPGSGKTSFTTALERGAGGAAVRVSQDDQGRKGAERAMCAHQCVLLDRCNHTAAQRREWLALAHNADAWCVFLDIPAEECAWRVQQRKDHPTLKPGVGAGRIIATMARELEAPTAEEGFSRVEHVTGQEGANQLLADWGVAPPEDDAAGLFKFPRTRHFADTGSGTRDDLVLTPAQCANFLNRPVDVEEKIDGANVGVSICAATRKVLVQNRSHFVTAAHHAQFKPLDKWLSQHSAELWALLRPGRDILFGEWCVATHSIPYTRLPDVFVAFDLYDRCARRFFSRERLRAALAAHTTIPLVACLHEGAVFTKPDQLLALAHGPSRYYDGPVEGVYLRVQGADGWLGERAKVVRGDFLCGNQHWAKNAIRLNGVARDAA